MISLDSRLKTAADMCRKGVVAADVGTDHALLACYLAQNGARSVIACDIKDGPLEAARRTVEETRVTNVSVVKSDGLSRIDYADDVIICGMGGELIADIVAGCRFLSESTRFILQPMTRAEILRERLYAAGFEIMEERAAHDAGRVYVVMLARYTGVIRGIDGLFAHTGKCRDPEYLRAVADKLMKKARGTAKSDPHSARAAELRALADIIYGKAVSLS